MTTAPTFTQLYLSEATEIISRIDTSSLERAAQMLAELRARSGRLFILGVGGSAANASHAVNDFRKIAGIETYAPTDNVSELTARTNDEGWATIFESWLLTSRISERDIVFVLSVGGGDLERNVSPNLVAALRLAKRVGAKTIGIVGRDGGYTAKVADVCILIPVVNAAHVTPHSEAFQAVVWHLLVSHPAVKTQQTKWESTASSSEFQRAVFLDRDGVLNKAIIRDGKPFPPSNESELELTPEAAVILAELRKNGFKLLVVSNQPDVARGSISRETVEKMNAKLVTALPIDDILVCYHTDSDNCECRKPKPGLLLTAAKAHHIDLAQSFMIGDRWRDVEAGKNAGCQSILIDFGYDEKRPDVLADARVESLRAAADWILHASPRPVARKS
jgi:D-sedoheptulose 7-phosphate isomerase